MPGNRRGVSLVELLVALVLLGLVGAVTLRTMLAFSRGVSALRERSALQADGRTGALLVQSELRELGAAPGGTADLIDMAADSVTYRAPRGHGISCWLGVGQIRLLDTPQLPFSALRAVAPGRDSLLLFVEGNPASMADDRWLRLPVLSAGASSCAGVPAIAIGTIDFIPLLPGAELAAVELGGPVTTFEVMRLKEYISTGHRWLGAESVSGGEAVQPVLGPLSGNGVTLAYLREDGAPTLDPGAVRRIELTLEEASQAPVARGWTSGPTGVVNDTIRTQVFLRNTPR
jgi:prepilin-type N-terminal cleavage/methylation domain-containing protein